MLVIPPSLSCSFAAFSLFTMCDQVDLPAEEVPPEIPEPALGINFARDGMQVCTIVSTYILLRSFYFCHQQLLTYTVFCCQELLSKLEMAGMHATAALTLHWAGHSSREERRMSEQQGLAPHSQQAGTLLVTYTDQLTCLFCCSGGTG